MSQSEQSPISHAAPSDSPHSGPHSPDPDPTPSPSDLNRSTAEDAEHHGGNLHQQLQNLDLKADQEGKAQEEEQEAEKNDGGDRESDKDADAYAAAGDDQEDDEEEEENENGENDGENQKKNEGRKSHYPVRPEAEDCSYYMKTGLCKFGSNCKFNHPVRRKNEAVKEKVKEKEELAEKPIQTECKGEKECLYYMRNGSCKFGANCRFNHPDPTATGAGDPPPAYGNGGSVSSQAASQVNMTSWSSPRAVNETPAYMPIMFPPTQGVPPPNLEWNGYQTTVYPQERSSHPTPPYVMSNPSIETTVYTHHQPPSVVDEFPVRPGQPECMYFMKTGDCKFKSNCKYHHPKNRFAKPAPCSLSDMGLPLRPDQSICSHYSRYGICKFGPACKFDHSVQAAPLPVSGLDQPLPFSDSSAIEQTGMAGSNGTDTAVQ